MGLQNQRRARIKGPSTKLQANSNLYSPHGSTRVFFRSAAVSLITMGIVIPLAATASSTAIIAFSSSFHTIQLWKQIFSKRRVGYEEIPTKLYEDEDGIATVESEARYSTYLQKGIIVLGTVAGLGFSLSVAIRSTGDRASSECISNWLVFVSWVY